MPGESELYSRPLRGASTASGFVAPDFVSSPSSRRLLRRSITVASFQTSTSTGAVSGGVRCTRAGSPTAGSAQEGAGQETEKVKRERRSRSSRSATMTDVRLGASFANKSRGEQVAAGWPAWLSAIAGEAINGRVQIDAGAACGHDPLRVGEGMCLVRGGCQVRSACAELVDGVGCGQVKRGLLRMCGRALSGASARCSRMVHLPEGWVNVSVLHGFMQSDVYHAAKVEAGTTRLYGLSPKVVYFGLSRFKRRD